MPGIQNVHDRFFKRIFGDVANVRSFLKIALPEKVRSSPRFWNCCTGWDCFGIGNSLPLV